MRRGFAMRKEASVGFSPLTPAFSPFREEGARRLAPIQKTLFAASAALWSFEPSRSETKQARRPADGLERASNATPSPLNGERAGVRGEAFPAAHTANHRSVWFGRRLPVGACCLFVFLIIVVLIIIYRYQ